MYFATVSDFWSSKKCSFLLIKRCCVITEVSQVSVSVLVTDL